MTENEKIVFGCMREERGNVYRTLECQPGTTKAELKRIIKKLRELNLIEVVSFIDPDGDVQGYLGRGWVLTGFGDSMQNHLDDKYFP